MNESALSAWRVDESGFPANGSIEEKLRFAVNYAILAPSSHNTQPWRFLIQHDTVQVCADRRRALPVTDPFDRELLISCGAALFNLRADGYIKLSDRKKDIILVSGFKVFPNEVEEVAMMLPGVLEAGATSVADERAGQAVKLFIVRRDPALSAEQVLAHCRRNLTGYKVPKYIEFRTELPKSPIGKVLRRELR